MADIPRTSLFKHAAVSIFVFGTLAVTRCSILPKVQRVAVSGPLWKVIVGGKAC